MSDSTKPVVAVVGLSDVASPLAPVWPTDHRALLPIAGKSVIAHLMEQLALFGIRRVDIAHSPQQAAVRRHLGDGQSWGLEIRYADLDGTGLRIKTLRNTGRCLYIPGDCLHLFDLSRIEARGMARTPNPEIRDETAAYWHMTPLGAARYSIQRASGNPYRRNPLLTATQFHLANLELAAGILGGLNLPGRAIGHTVQVDWGSKIAADASLGGAIAIGKRCRIGRGVCLQRNCVIGNDVIISRDTHLYNVTVLPNSFIGPGTRLRDAIVSPCGVFELDGTFWPIDDAAVLGHVPCALPDTDGVPTRRYGDMKNRVRQSPGNRRNESGMALPHPAPVVCTAATMALPRLECA